MGKLLFSFLILSSICFGQSKKEQIESLNSTIDSLNTVLQIVRDNSAKDINSLNNKIQEISDEVTTLKKDLMNLQSSNNTLTKENDKLKAEVKRVYKKERIKEINQRLEKAFKEESITRLIGDNYTYILKDSKNIEFIYELGYDSEGWPMEGEIYYFHAGELIGYAYMNCDGCIGIEIYENISQLSFADYNSKDDDLSSINNIYVLNSKNSEMEEKAQRLLRVYQK